MMRLSYRLYLWATALNYQLPRRLTKGGLLTGTVMILAGAIGSDLDQSVAFQAFALAFGLLLVGAAWVPFFRGRFAVRRALPRLATVDQAFRYRVEVRNETGGAYRGLDLLEDLADPRPNFHEFAEVMGLRKRMSSFRLSQGTRQHLEHRQANVRLVTLPQIEPRQTAGAEMEVVPLRRGPLRFKGLTIARPDPLGLVRSFVRVSAPQTVLVLPKRYPVPALALTGGRHYQSGGVSMASSIGESEEFISLRDYRPGDPFRRIHWRTWARAGRPIVKEFQDEHFARQALVFDTCIAGGEIDAFEEAVSVAASFACCLETQESLLDLLFAGPKAFCFTTGRGLGQSEQVLEILASVRPSRETDFPALRDQVQRHAPLISACTCVLLKWNEPRRDMVRRLRAQNIPVLVLVVAGAGSGEALVQEDDPAAGPIHVLRLGRIAQDLLALEKGAQ